MLLIRLSIGLFLSACLASCFVFDSGVEWRGGPYSLVWIDTSDNTGLYREIDKGGAIGRVDATVFAVGWDGRYLVAKQHISEDRSQTNYYIIDALRDTDYANPSDVVIGPLTADEYRKKTDTLKLPEFTKVLRSLE